MMLFKLSLKNISKSIRDYAIYFFTLVLGVAIFYVFNAIDSQTVMLNVSSSTYEVIKLMTTILSGVNVFVSFILGFLIVYASRFLIKRRNKEFGIYLTLGISKRKISLILFLETLIIGIISLGVGLFLGTVLSQFMSILVANMFEADLTNFKFVFSSEAMVKSLIYFGIMYLIVMLFNTIMLNKCKLIDLLHSNKKSETVKLKNPWLCLIVFIASVGMLGYAYYLVTFGYGKASIMSSVKGILVPIFMGMVSTFLIFWSLSGLVLRITMRFKKFYYRGLNSFTIRQISSKINTTVFSMTVICLMLFFTICIFSSALSLKGSLSKSMRELAPIDVQFQKVREVSEDSDTSDVIIGDNNVSLRDTLKRLDIYGYLTDVTETNVYRMDSVTMGDTFGDRLDSVMSEYPFLAINTRENLVSESDFNRLAKLLGEDSVHLEDGEYVIIANYQMMANVRNSVLKYRPAISINGKSYVPKGDRVLNGFMELDSSYTNVGFIVLPDEAVAGLEPYKTMLSANYKARSDADREKIEEVIGDAMEEYFNVDTLITYNSKLDIYEASVGMGALVTFIGLYLGIIFLISSAAILALKELSESADNRERFGMLRKIGADENMINRALFRQIFIFFMVPLGLAIIHSIFGISFANYILKSIGTKSTLSSIVLTAVFLVVIYGGYFMVTYFASKNIIKEDR